MARVREYSAVKTPNVPTPQTTLGNVCVTRDSKAMVKPVLVSTCNSTIGQSRRVMLSLLLKEKIKKLHMFMIWPRIAIFSLKKIQTTISYLKK